MAIIGTPPTEEELRYALEVTEKSSRDGKQARHAAAVDGSPQHREQGKSRTGAGDGGLPNRGGRAEAEQQEVVIPLTPVDAEAEADKQSGLRLHAGQLSALMSAANQRPDLIGAIRKARENLPGDPAFGDPLSLSGPGGPQTVARAAAGIVGVSPSAAKEIGLGALQVWQAMLERVGRGKGSQPITVMFTDLVAFSRWSLTAGDEATLELLRRVASVIEPPISDSGGRVIKRMGDGVMAIFLSPDSAVRAAITAKRRLAELDMHGYRPQMRIGLHTGTPRAIGGDWLGVDVTIAARMMEAGGNGNTMLSHATLDALAPETLAELGCAAKPYRRGRFAAPLSGVPEDLRIFRLE